MGNIFIFRYIVSFALVLLFLYIILFLIGVQYNSKKRKDLFEEIETNVKEYFTLAMLKTDDPAVCEFQCKLLTAIEDSDEKVLKYVRDEFENELIASQKIRNLKNKVNQEELDELAEEVVKLLKIKLKPEVNKSNEEILLEKKVLMLEQERYKFINQSNN